MIVLFEMRRLYRDTGAKKRNIATLAVTALIVLGLLLAGPAEAVKVNLQSDKNTYSGDDNTVTFSVSVDIQKNERVPIQTLTLRINDGFRTCEFLPDGNSSCPNIDIHLIHPGVVSTGDQQDKGFGFENTEAPHDQKTDFGFGYGFEEEQKKAGFKGELTYEIKWHIGDDSVPNGKYTASLEAFAQNGETHFTYITKNPKSFNINVKSSTEGGEKHRAKFSGDYAEIDHIDDESDFSKENAQLVAEVKKESSVNGYTSLNAYAEESDTTKVQLEVQMKNFDLDAFTIDHIEFDSMADVVYHKTKQGAWVNGHREGFEPPVEIRTKVPVHLNLHDGKIFVDSDNPSIPFSITLRVTEFQFK